MSFGTRIQSLLNEQGITQRRLASDLHLNPNTINGYIKNRRLPDCFILSEIARYLGTNIDYLLGNTNIKVYPNLALNEREAHLLSCYRSMSQDRQLILEEISHSLCMHCTDNITDSAGNPR